MVRAARFSVWYHARVFPRWPPGLFLRGPAWLGRSKGQPRSVSTSGLPRSKATVGASRSASISLYDIPSCGRPLCQGSPATEPSTSWVTRRGRTTIYGIYRAELINGEYAKPELLPRSINLPPFLNWAPFIAPDESYLLFSSNRTGSLDEYGDLYISRRQADGSWTDPVSSGRAGQHARAGSLPRTVARREIPVLLPVHARSQERCLLGGRGDHSGAAFHHHSFTGEAEMRKTSAIIVTLIVLLTAGLAAQQHKSARQAIPASAAIFFTESGLQLNRQIGYGVELANRNQGNDRARKNGEHSCSGKWQFALHC